MSGRKQHYIPQFVLRAFGNAGKGKKCQVKVITPEKTFVVPTDGVGAQREFYSQLGSGELTLDDEITYAETIYTKIHREILGSPSNSKMDSQKVARLLAHLSIRGNNLRGSVTAASTYAVSRAGDLFSDPAYIKKSLGIGEAQPTSFLREAFDAKYNEMKGKLVKAGVSRHDFRRLMFSQLNVKWPELEADALGSLVDLISILYVKSMVADGHKLALRRDMEPAKRVEALASLTWVVRDWDAPVFVLPDSIALSHDPERGAMPAAYVSNEMVSGVLFPLSPTRAVCGGSYQHSGVLETLVGDFPTFAALASWDFIITNPSFNDRTFDSSLIGRGIGQFIFSNIEDAVQEDIASTFAE